MHDFIFDRKGVFFIKLENIEGSELEYIDHGLESIEKVTEEEGNFYKVYVAFENFGTM